MPNHSLTRRAFLAATTTTALLATTRIRANDAQVIPRKLSPNEKLNVAGVGVGGQGLTDIMNCREENVVALCDVDWARAGEAFYKLPGAKQYKDFRKMLEEMPEIDAVTVSTPDFMHAQVAYRAMKLGKHVYVQKPLAHTPMEARLLTRTAAATGVATQMGNQGHSGSGARQFCEIFWSGAIGEVSFADCMEGKSWCCGAETPGAVAPETLDWNLWQGPTPESAYIKDIAPANWRRYWKYGNGTLGDMACHILDLPFWALGLADKGGLRAEIRADGPPPDAVGCPKSLEISWALTWFGRDKQRDPLILRWFDGGRPSPTLQELSSKNKQDYSRFSTLFQGSKGFLLANYDEYLVLPQALAETITIPPAVLARPAGHQREWMDSVRAWTMDLPRSAAPTSSDFTYASKLTEMVLSGTIAYRAQAPISYDFVRGSVSGAGSVAATALLATPCRSGWSLERCDFDRDIGASVG